MAFEVINNTLSLRGSHMQMYLIVLQEFKSQITAMHSSLAELTSQFHKFFCRLLAQYVISFLDKVKMAPKAKSIFLSLLTMTNSLVNLMTDLKVQLLMLWYCILCGY